MIYRLKENPTVFYLIIYYTIIWASEAPKIKITILITVKELSGRGTTGPSHPFSPYENTPANAVLWTAPDSQDKPKGEYRI